MRPVDFVLYDGDSAPNTPVYLIREAVTKTLKIFGPTGEFVAVGYHYDKEGECMVLDVKLKEKNA